MSGFLRRYDIMALQLSKVRMVLEEELLDLAQSSIWIQYFQKSWKYTEGLDVDGCFVGVEDVGS